MTENEFSHEGTKSTKARRCGMRWASLSAEEEAAGRALVQSAYRAHVALGPGLLESAYRECLALELRDRGHTVQTELKFPITYRGVQLASAYRLDVLISGLVICEIKAVRDLHPVYKAQVLTYLKLSGRRLGFLINFNVPRLKEGVHRFVN